MTEAFDEKSAGRILGHPVRQRILELLGTKGPLSWKELSDSLGISTGVLYYHLDMLEGLVTRDKSRKYVLTKVGVRASQYLQDTQSPTPNGAAAAMGKGTSTFRELFAPRSLIANLGANPQIAALSFGVISAGQLALLFVFGYTQVLFAPIPSSSVWFASLGFLGSVAALVIVGSVASVQGGSRPSLTALIPGSAVSLVPVSVFGALTRLVPLLAKTPWAYTPLLILAQAWCATVFASSLSASSGIRIERALLVSLFLLYASIAVVLFQNGLL